MTGTALHRYELLEAVGLYTEGPAARPIELVVKFGEVSLTLYDLEDRPQAHWALASLRGRRSAPDGSLTLLPGEDSSERLVLSDPDMIEALRLVCPDLERPRPRRGWLRRLLWTGAAGLAAVGLGVALLPGLDGQTARILPQAKADRLGLAMLGHLLRDLGDGVPVATCATPEGARALTRLLDRLRPASTAPPVPIRLHVLDHPALTVVGLPGGHVLVFRGFLTAAEGPEELAALIAHEIGHAGRLDPARRALDLAGTAGLVALLLGDGADGGVPERIARAMLTPAYPAEVEAAAGAEADRLMTAAGLPLIAGESARLRVAEADIAPRSHLTAPLAPQSPTSANFVPALEDQDWVALQGMCDR